MMGLKFLILVITLNIFSSVCRCQQAISTDANDVQLEELHLENEFVSGKHHHHHHDRAKRNVFYDMIQDFTGMNDDDESDEEDDEGEDEVAEGGGGGGYSSAATTESSGSSESSTTRFGRFMSPLAFSKISETLGALNTVGRYIVNMTRKEPSITNHNPSENVPNAILTLTKNVLGQNVTKTIEPMIKRIGIVETHGDPSLESTTLPSVKDYLLNATLVSSSSNRDAKHKKTKSKVTTSVNKAGNNNVNRKDQFATTTPVIHVDNPTKIVDYQSKESENRCRTPDGRPGRCDDLSNCPGLLLDLTHLRESLCFKSLFVPGVCCPLAEHSDHQQSYQTTQQTTLRPLRLTTKPSLFLNPVSSTTQSTQRPLVPVFTISSSTVTQAPTSIASTAGIPSSAVEPLGNFVDSDDCGQQEYSSGRIVGGVEAPTGQWPWLAAIFLHGPKRTEFWCGGSLIGSKYVLTAAHCTRDSRQRPFAAKQFTVRLGDIDLSTDNEPSAPVTFKVKDILAHPRFSRVGFYNDIAIMTLDQPVRKSKYVIPVCLPKPQTPTVKEKLVGRRATIVGWGTTYYGGKESAMQRQAMLPIWRNDDCNRAYFQPITDNFLCAGYSEGGGPLMLEIDSRWVQLGIVSFGNKCGEPSYPGVYTRVSEYLEWIRENTRD